MLHCFIFLGSDETRRGYRFDWLRYTLKISQSGKIFFCVRKYVSTIVDERAEGCVLNLTTDDVLQAGVAMFVGEGVLFFDTVSDAVACTIPNAIKIHLADQPLPV